MNEKMTNAAMAIVGVVLAYALYDRFKKPAAVGAKVAPFAVGEPFRGATNPAGPEYNPAMPGQYVTTDNLIYGAVTGQNWETVPTVDEMINGVVYGNSNSGAPKGNSLLLPGGFY